MRILLTGATGLIGSAILNRLSDTHDIITLGRRPTSDLRADLTAPSTLKSVELGRVDALVHCAGIVDEDFQDDAEAAFRSALAGADTLIRVALAAGARRLVYVSSAHVYGPMVGYKDEASVPDPRSDYAIAHFATEQVFRRYITASISGLALRPCAVFGDLPDPSAFRRWSLIPFSFPRDAALSRSIRIRSTGEQRRNFVGTEDIASTVARWLTSNPEGWSVINPLGASTMSVFEFAKLCADVAQGETGETVEVSRLAAAGMTTDGDAFSYGSRSPFAEGSQDLRAVVAGLICDLGARR